MVLNIKEHEQFFKKCVQKMLTTANDSRYVRLSDLSETDSLEAYEAMSKDELIQELVKARIAEARLKKGYEVKGDGTVIHYSSRNTR